jgi:hypothetical protein
MSKNIIFRIIFKNNNLGLKRQNNFILAMCLILIDLLLWHDDDFNVDLYG